MYIKYSNLLSVLLKYDTLVWLGRPLKLELTSEGLLA